MKFTDKPLTIDHLNLLLSEGEGYSLEFKESVSSSLSRKLTAFANSSGGIVLIGVNDSGEISCHELTNRERSRIQDIAGTCQPAVSITDDGGTDRLTHAGFLFFAELPELARSYWDITCALYKGTDKVHILDRKDFWDDFFPTLRTPFSSSCATSTSATSSTGALNARKYTRFLPRPSGNPSSMPSSIGIISRPGPG